MPTPLLLADPHKDVAPHAYVVQVTRTICRNCGAAGKTCELFAKTNLRSQMGHKYVTNLRPMKSDAPKYKLPLTQIDLPTQHIAFCCDCPNPNDVTASLPLPPIETKPHIVGLGLQHNDPKPTPKTPKKPQTQASSSDDLMKGLDI